jgi:hypothetical protein
MDAFTFGLFEVTVDKGRASSPTVTGDIHEINKYAWDRGWTWKKNDNVFGGYYNDGEIASYKIDLVFFIGGHNDKRP